MNMMKREIIPRLVLCGMLLAGCTNKSPSLETAASSVPTKATPAPKSSKPSGAESSVVSHSNTVTITNGNGANLFFGSMLDPMTQHQSDVLTESFQSVKSYWERRLPALGGIAATQLVVLSHDASFNCPTAAGKPQTVEASDPNGTQYCQTLGKIVVTEGLVSYIAASLGANNTDPVLEFFDDHEFGHVVQAANGELQPGKPTTPEMEQQADCYAGTEFQAIDPQHIAAVEASFSIFPTDDHRHGSPQQREASFERGVAGGMC
jgi:predicted metalloprotease